jgi:ABC-type antimicrobial peptide transport system permease subunit
VIALGVGKLISSQALVLRIFDLPVYIASVAVVLAAAALAAAIPARVASRLDPMTILRHD